MDRLATRRILATRGGKTQLSLSCRNIPVSLIDFPGRASLSAQAMAQFGALYGILQFVTLAARSRKARDVCPPNAAEEATAFCSHPSRRNAAERGRQTSSKTLGKTFPRHNPPQFTS